MVVANAPRNVRAALVVAVNLGSLPLHIVGPKDLPEYAGKSGWFYVTNQNGTFYLLSKKPLKTRIIACQQATHRFGRKVTEFKKQKIAA